MPYSAKHEPEPTRETVDQMTGPVVVEFGTDWCPYCQALQPVLRNLLKDRADVRHVKVMDGKGQPLGRSFQVKLWPNIVLLRDGKVLQQLARPSEAELRAAFAALGGP